MKGKRKIKIHSKINTQIKISKERDREIRR